MSPRARLGLIAGLGLAAAVGLLLHGPIPQDQAYHDFADGRTLLGIPNFWNVVSNGGFIIAGLAGFAALAKRCRSRRTFIEPWEAIPFGILFAGMVLVGIGSGYYHWRPIDERLVWDRITLTINMMGMFGIMVIERISLRWGARLFLPWLLIGAGSVLWWKAVDDLRLYGFVQFFPMVAVPLMLLLWPPRYTRTRDLYAVVAWYAFAKICEHTDAPIYRLLGHQLSGHSIKHLAAGVAFFWIVLWMARREPVSAPTPAAESPTSSRS